jgi:BlaI family penicillinase repressor
MRIAPSKEFGRRERQIMDVVYRLGRATVGDVMGRLPNPPTYSAVRAMLRYLEGKGHLRHTRDGVRYVYEPTLPHAEAQRSAIQHLLRTFFRGSRAGAVAALLELPGKELSDGELARLRALVRRARREGR